ncbi:MAG TPA: acetylornithine deacetylase [Pyrinomonadaceae bacterium]|jgi:acetylornithine deacetylase|nr:acetylornithine deacetylase [Pyrinomonadaceae bacterium]
MGVEQTLAELVAIDSTSSRPNVELIDFLARRAEGAGLSARRLPYADERGVEKQQLVAVYPHDFKEGEEVELALVGHTDTVPFDPAWGEALRLTERGGNLYGRGACDTKGFIAAALAAVEEVDLKSLTRPLALVFTADEEVGCLGAKQLAESRPFRARHAVVGEPTSLTPMRAGKGYCLAEVTVRGREAHSAYPSIGASAITRAARLVSRVERIAEELTRDAHPAFDPPHTTLNVGLIQGGTAKNIIPGLCRFTLEWRPVPGRPPDRVVELLRREVEDLRASDSDFECEINVVRLDGGAETPEGAPLVRALEELTGRAAGAVSFGTEAPQLAELGAAAVVFGPGDIRVAHRTGEFVPASELREAASILRRVIERFCAAGHP